MSSLAMEHISNGVSSRHRDHHLRHLDKLRRSCEALIRVHRDVREIGRAEEIEALGHQIGLAETDFAAFDVNIRGRRASLVCVPMRLWHRASTMSAFFELKSMAAVLGKKVVLVPETFVRRQPRLANAEMINDNCDLEITATDRMNVLAHLLENGGSTLIEVASVIRHSDPVGAILQLVTVGALEIDLDSPILPVSPVWLPGTVNP